VTQGLEPLVGEGREFGCTRYNGMRLRWSPTS
jgi:hypothetical protein